MFSCVCAGTKEYLTHVNRIVDASVGRIDELFETRFKNLERQTQQFSTAAGDSISKDLLAGVQDIVQQHLKGLYSQIMANLGGQISQKVTSFVKEELREQQSVMHESMVSLMRSGVATPGGQVMAHQQRSLMLMQEVKAALDKRDYNTAFRLALSATDLDAVLFVCEKVKTKEVKFIIFFCNKKCWNLFFFQFKQKGSVCSTDWLFDWLVGWCIQ